MEHHEIGVCTCRSLHPDAADEIERLHAAVTELREQNEQLVTRLLMQGETLRFIRAIVDAMLEARG